MNVPAFDLSRAHRRIADEIDRRFHEVLDRTAFVGGPEVAAFETAFASYLGAAGAVGVANGTDALVVALRALDLAPGDEVLVPTFSFIATASAVVLAGGRPVFVDVEGGSLNLDVPAAEARVTARTVGMIGVHLYGRPFDVGAALKLCTRRGLWLVEDAAQAHGAAVGDRRVGTFGRLATWSFYPSKNLGAFGDGGAVTGGDAGLLDRVRRVANHGREGHYLHTEIGTNSRLDGLQAAVLNARLPRLDEDNARRREIAARYRAELAGIGDLVWPEERPETVAVHHQLTVRSARRDALKEHLAQRGIGSAIHYPLPLHRQPALAPYALDGLRLPVAERAAEEVLSLPMFPELTDEEVATVVSGVRSFFAG